MSFKSYGVDTGGKTEATGVESDAGDAGAAGLGAGAGGGGVEETYKRSKRFQPKISFVGSNSNSNSFKKLQMSYRLTCVTALAEGAAEGAGAGAGAAFVRKTEIAK